VTNKDGLCRGARHSGQQVVVRREAGDLCRAPLTARRATELSVRWISARASDTRITCHHGEVRAYRASEVGQPRAPASPRPGPIASRRATPASPQAAVNIVAHARPRQSGSAPETQSRSRRAPRRAPPRRCRCSAQPRPAISRSAVRFCRRAGRAEQLETKAHRAQCARSQRARSAATPPSYTFVTPRAGDVRHADRHG